MSEPIRERVQAALGDAYTIDRALAADRWKVFVARSEALGRDVVLKVLPPEEAAGVDLARFKREISFAARLEDPTIVPIVAWGDADGLPYVAMPFVADRSLRDLKLPSDRALYVLRDVARALAHAHGRGVLHRDLTADRVFVSDDGAVVAGFGVTRALEAARGRDVDPSIDNRTDILAFGRLAQNLISGERRPAVTALIGRCTSPSPRDRPESASQIVEMLDDMVSPSLGLLDQFWPTDSATIDARIEHYRTRLFVALVVLAVVVGIAAFFAWRATRSARRAVAVAPPTTSAPRPAKARVPTPGDSLAAVAESWLARGDSSIAAKEALAQARATIARGLTLYPNNASLRFSEGVVAYLYDRDAAAALGYMRGAIASDPDVPGALDWYPQVLWANGLRDTASVYVRRAIARDSTSIPKLVAAWRYAHLSGDALRALQFCGALRQLHEATYCEAMQQVDVSQTEAALVLTAQAAARAGARSTGAQLDYVMVLVAAGQLDSARKVVAAADRQAGPGGAARAPAGAGASFMRADDVALMHGFIGDSTGALQWLERALAEDAPGIGALYWRTVNNPLRHDPRLLAFAKKAGLGAPPPYWP